MIDKTRIGVGRSSWMLKFSRHPVYTFVRIHPATRYPLSWELCSCQFLCSCICIWYEWILTLHRHRMLALFVAYVLKRWLRFRHLYTYVFSLGVCIIIRKVPGRGVKSRNGTEAFHAYTYSKGRYNVEVCIIDLPCLLSFLVTSDVRSASKRYLSQK